jgi:hypothetical protein
VRHGHDPLHDKFLQRTRLVEAALEHHNNGAYKPSDLLVLAQVVGIIDDLPLARTVGAW